MGISGDCGVVRPELVPWAIRALVNCGGAEEVEVEEGL